jgi:phosphatidylethanolamine-binding protein (PEBP) family uncharacterized protein
VTDFALSSEAFAHGEAIPQRHACEGQDVSPPLSWTDPPAGTRALALVVDDPDAPVGTFTHWLAWSIAPGALDEALDIGEGAGRHVLERALRGHVLTTAELMGTYER